MLAVAAATFLLHAALSGRYGYFRDELYYLDLAHHLAPGYVDCAPLIAFYARFALLLGGSLPALRILPALASAGTVALAMYIAWQLGGRAFAQFFAGFCIFLNPGRLMLDSLMTMNSFEPLFWMGCIAVLIRIVQTGNSRLWPWFGLLAGLGLENKHSTVFFGAAVVLALLLTEHRREFLKPWIWLAGAIALLLFLPNLVWQVRHHFPTLEDLENVRRSGKNVILSPPAFVLQQVMANHPLLLPVWLAGVVSFLRHRSTRVLGYTFLVFFLIMMAMHAKDYYLFPMYPLAFAGGAVAFERWLNARPQPAARALRFATPAVLFLLTLPIFPLQLPILSPPRYVAYTAWLGFKQPKTETHHQSEWPQAFADQIGWEQLTAEVARIFRALPPGEQAHAGIRASNYGEAGAIDFFGPRYGLPQAICAHQNHFFWGPPPQTPQTIIYLQSDLEMLKQNCASVEQAGVHYNRYGMGEENEPIYVCRGPRFDYRQTWPSLKHWN
jgi:Dolichyl-phosphate-mannose-protein mannosyltransferase